MAREPTPSEMPGEAPTDDQPPAPLIWPVLVLSLATVVISPFLINSVVGRTVSAALIGATAVIALLRSDARRSVVLGGEVVLVAVTVVGVITRDLGSPDDWLSAVATALYCLLLLVTPLVVVIRLTRRPRITLDTVAGLLAAYIQFGLFFASLYNFVQLVDSTPFFAGMGEAGYMDFQFFSFTTLTTLGYGNLVPASDVGQTIAIIEAIVGQVFLVTVVAIAVSNLGAAIPSRSRRRS